MTVLAQVPTPEAIRRATEEVLARPEYAETRQAETLLDRLLGFLLEGLGRLLARIDAAGGPDGSVVAGLALLGIVVALALLGARVLRRFRRTAVLPPDGLDAVGRSAVDWEAEAVAHERAGAHKDALRCRYRQVVAVLAAEGLVDEVPGRTTGEYRRAVAIGLPTAATPFGSLTEAFERAWYGGRPVDEQAYQAALSHQADVLRASGSRSRARPTATAGAGSSA